jgi:hypothetical protein
MWKEINSERIAFHGARSLEQRQIWRRKVFYLSETMALMRIYVECRASLRVAVSVLFNGILSYSIRSLIT